VRRLLKTTKEFSKTTAPAYFDSIETIKDELEESRGTLEGEKSETLHAEPGMFEAVKVAIKGHGEQMVLPDDCEFGDNDLCYVET